MVIGLRLGLIRLLELTSDILISMLINLRTLLVFMNTPFVVMITLKSYMGLPTVFMNTTKFMKITANS